MADKTALVGHANCPKVAHGVQNRDRETPAFKLSQTQNLRVRYLALAVLTNQVGMKKLAVIVVLAAAGGVACVFVLKPQLAKAQSAKPGQASTTPAQFVNQLFGRAKSALGNIAFARNTKPADPQPNPSLKIINSSPTGIPEEGNSTNAAAHDPKVQAGLKAMNQLAVRGILVSGNRSSAIIQTGRQTMPVFAGDTLSIKTADGLVMLRCEKIDRRTVWLRIPQTPVLAELSLP